MTVDIIMPCYYSNDIIIPALESIANQTAINNIILIMVNDCSPYTNCEYQDLIQKYSNQINIKYLKTQQNVGPGQARQLGIDNSSSDFVLFLDDDDELYANDTIENFLKIINQNPDVAFISGEIKNVVKDNNQKNFQTSIKGSVQGTIFDRKILNKYNIRFEPDLSFKEEDGTFNTLLLLKTVNEKSIVINEPVYLRKRLFHNNSITSTTSCLDSFIALMGNKAYQMKYLWDEKNINKKFFNIIIEEGIAFIPNLLNNLVKYLEQKKDILITKDQLSKITKYIEIYNLTLKKYNINIDTIDINNINNMIVNVFNEDSFFGNFDLNVIYYFNLNVYKQLQTIRYNFLKKD